MLCQFSVKNFRCIKNEITLDMQAANINEKKESLLVDKDGEKFLPLSVIYGPNGGGKSTVLDAIYSLCAKVMRPVLAANDNELKNESFNAQIQPYHFDEAVQKKSTDFEIYFRTENYEYQYSLSVFASQIIEESLYHKRINGRQYTKIFSRNSQGELLLKGSLRGYSAKGISETLPLLSYLAITHLENPTVKAVMDWFQHEVLFLDYKRNDMERYMNLPDDSQIKKIILNVFQGMGLDIVDYRIEKTEDPKLIKIYTIHKVNGKKYELDLHGESSGTIKIFNSIPFIISILLHGGTLIVDELDAKLHPMLLQYIIQLFNDPDINKGRGQLIFTSQDIMTMTSENFRRDEIWFAAKNIEEATQVYSLVEFKDVRGKGIRRDASYNKQYMEGRYGADPFLRKLVEWEVTD